ncbi:MAG: gamma-glutamylcyclotransferase [Rhodobacteraceae bacterium]|nr:gamma-glutamylcyclotransferase [Paracoccaceae bacterium]MCP5342873.1 gamma-glutamylcyclotransferase [Paracoccaceae bacterium]
MGGAALAIGRMTDCFFYGTLCHAPLLTGVLGRAVAVEPALLPSHSVFWAAGGAFPVIVAGGDGARGVLARDLTDADLARLDFYEDGYDARVRMVRVEGQGAACAARVYFPESGRWQAGAPWCLADWVARWGPAVTATAEDFMRHQGLRPPAELLARYPMMLMRGGARARARGPAPEREIRRKSGPQDVAVDRCVQTYANYFSVEEYDLRFRRFDGAMSETVNRAVFLSGDASVVLPYDPVRDRVLVIEQFRMGPFARGDLDPWLIEAVAGRVDGGETPEEAARREAGEEAGIALRELIPARHYYPSPAAKGEYLYTYVGIADLPDRAAGVAGLAGEAEDIRAHILSFDRLMALVDSGEIDSAPLIVLAYWLERRRAGLRAAAGGA